jgi:uncharacterized repeat protein (TIGR03803 family)
MKFFCSCAGATLAGTLLAACGGNHGFSPPISAGPAAAAPLSSGSGTETVLYKFKGGTDGEWPVVPAPLYANGVLYGTTTYGGNSTCAVNGSPAGCGTVFRIDTSGDGYKVIHRFPKSGLDGNTIFAGLSEAGGMLYGTTQWGGGQGDSYQQCSGYNGCGTVFEMGTDGKEFKTLNEFGGSDGMNIRPGSVDSSGTLYGAASGNGTGSSSACISYSQTGCGLVYSLANGKEKILHTFGGSPDGYGPFFSPLVVKGTLYGVTVFGGINSPDCVSVGGDGCGVVYEITDGTRYKVLYRFKGGKDGYAPWGVTYSNGKLYGDAIFGGDTGSSNPCKASGGTGCGTIFELDTSGKGFRTLYRFMGHSDGWFPNLPAVSGNTIYVSAELGGDATACGSNGCGTVIRLSTSGKDVKVLYQFQGGNDAWYPNAVTVQNGTIYGTSFWGGGSGCGGNGCGTVFEIAP